MALVRRCNGYRRYIFSVQYNGTPFIGFSYQGPKGENCILPHTNTDLRGVFSIEGKIRHAFSALFGGVETSSFKHNENDIDNLKEQISFENFQVSSRTDRGVHALKNTFHTDIRIPKDKEQYWEANRFVRGLNFHLIRQAQEVKKEQQQKSSSISYYPLSYGRTGSFQKVRLCEENDGHNYRTDLFPNSALIQSTEHDIRILSCQAAPLEQIPNKHFNDQITPSPDNLEYIDWHARFTATSRTYTYRILLPGEMNANNNYGTPFEANTCWILSPSKNRTLDVESMKDASKYLIGYHDFSSFRGKNCQRFSPHVNIQNISIEAQPYSPFGIPLQKMDSNSMLLTITIQGEAFLYNQVRNMVGCFVSVGKGQITAKDVEGILDGRDRSLAPAMAPAHGLFLVNVQHGDLSII